MEIAYALLYVALITLCCIGGFKFGWWLAGRGINKAVGAKGDDQ